MQRRRMLSWHTSLLCGVFLGVHQSFHSCSGYRPRGKTQGQQSMFMFAFHSCICTRKMSHPRRRSHLKTKANDLLEA